MAFDAAVAVAIVGTSILRSDDAHGMPGMATAIRGIGTIDPGLCDIACVPSPAPVSASQNLGAMADKPSSWANIVAVEEEEEEWAGRAAIPVDLQPELQDMMSSMPSSLLVWSRSARW